jgi:N-formylmaleamate deformylase
MELPVELPLGSHVRVNGIRQHALRFGGRGARMVVVPGIVSPAMLWAHVGQWLGACCEVHVLDVRGRGLSEAGPHLDYGVEACARDVAGFVREKQLGPVIVMGHSMGARIAARAVARFGEHFRAAVLLDPPTSGPGRRPYPIPAERTLGLLRAAQRGEAWAAPVAGTGTGTGTGTGVWPDDLQHLRAEWLPTCDERAVRQAYEDFHGEDFFADLAQAPVPLSLLCAGEGGVVSDEDVAEMQRLHPDIAVVRLAGVGHQMQAENFGAFKRALAPLLRRHDAGFEELTS